MTYPVQPIQTILAAVNFAAQKHSNQHRSGAAAEPFVNHLVEVAELVAGALSELDTNLVIAALLHDSVEDAGVTIEELTQRFGTDVAELVDEVTDDKTLPKQERKRLQVVNAPLKSERAQMIKIADKISNLRSLHSSPPIGWDSERKTEYIRWAKQVVSGLAKPNPILLAEFDAVLDRLRAEPCVS